MAKSSQQSANDDLIVINDGEPRIGLHGEDISSPPSSPPSSAPATELGSPEISSPARHPRGPGRPTRRSDYNDTLDPLRALTALRPIPWYEGKELSEEKSVESARVQTRGACLLASRGEVNDPPCTHCQSGVGRFSKCISLDDWFHGACATCQLATRGNLCSLRKDSKGASVKSESEHPATPLADMPAAHSPTADMVSTKKSSRHKRAKTSSTATDLTRGSTGELSDNGLEGSATTSNAARPTSSDSLVHLRDAPRPTTEYQSQFPRPGSILKRKRESLQETTAYNKPYVSPYAPLDPPNRLASSLPNTPLMGSNAIIPAYAPRDSPAYQNYIAARQETSKPGFVAINGHPYGAPFVQNGRPMRHAQAEVYDRDRTQSLSPSAQMFDPRPLPPPNPQMIQNRPLSRPPSAQVLHSRPPSLPLSVQTPNDRLQSPSLEPPPKRKPLPEPTRMTTRNTQKKNHHNTSSAAKPNSSKALNPRDAAPFDKLPPRKQKKILETIGGLESGIKGLQQQVDDMQKRLQALQALMGVEVGDDKDA